MHGIITIILNQHLTEGFTASNITCFGKEQIGFRNTQLSGLRLRRAPTWKRCNYRNKAY